MTQFCSDLKKKQKQKRSSVWPLSRYLVGQLLGYDVPFLLFEGLSVNRISRLKGDVR